MSDIDDTGPTSATAPTPTPAPQAQASLTRAPSLQKTLSFAHGTFKDIWFYVAAVSLIFNIMYTFRPQIIVQAATVSDNDPLATLFTITNQSAWTFYDVDMTCVIWDGDKKLVTLSNNSEIGVSGSAPSGNPIIEILEPYKPATRDCGTMGRLFHFSGMNPEAIRIDTIMSYKWLFGYKGKETSFHFSTRHAGPKFILVPDVESPFPPFRWGVSRWGS